MLLLLCETKEKKNEKKKRMRSQSIDTEKELGRKARASERTSRHRYVSNKKHLSLFCADITPDSVSKPPPQLTSDAPCVRLWWWCKGLGGTARANERPCHQNPAPTADETTERHGKGGGRGRRLWKERVIMLRGGVAKG